MPERAFFVSKKIYMKFSSIALLLNIFQIAIAAAPVEPVTLPTPETLTSASAVVAESPLESTHRVVTATITAYTARIQETDSSPCIAASGYDICENADKKNVVAANFVPFGTKLMIPKVFGDKVFIVEDRMNARFNDMNIVDVLFTGKTPQDAVGSAVKFGRKKSAVVILEE